MTYLALGVCLAVLVFLGLWFGRRPSQRSLPEREADPVGPRIVVDGSNVMHWGGQGPSVDVLSRVLTELQGRGFVPLILFDANVGYKLEGRHMDEAALADKLPVLERQIGIVQSGQPADPFVIEEAISQKARVVSNDRFMDWRGTYPAIRGKGFLVKGRMVGKRVELRL